MFNTATRWMNNIVPHCIQFHRYEWKIVIEECISRNSKAPFNIWLPNDGRKGTCTPRFGIEVLQSRRQEHFSMGEYNIEYVEYYVEYTLNNRNLNYFATI